MNFKLSVAMGPQNETINAGEAAEFNTPSIYLYKIITVNQPRIHRKQNTQLVSYQNAL